MRALDLFLSGFDIVCSALFCTLGAGENATLRKARCNPVDAYIAAGQLHRAAEDESVDSSLHRDYNAL